MLNNDDLTRDSSSMFLDMPPSIPGAGAAGLAARRMMKRGLDAEARGELAAIELHAEAAQ